MAQMKRLIALLSAFVPLLAAGQGFGDFGHFFGLPKVDGFSGAPFDGSSGKPVTFAYDVGFDYNFDNREYGRSEGLYSRSMTINAARLTPSFGIDINQSEVYAHRVMLGIDIMKDMGASQVSEDDKNISNWDLFKEITLYYRFRANLPKSAIEVYAGAFPDWTSEGVWGTEFISDSLRFFDTNIEGWLFKLTRPRSYYEYGLDWCGMLGSGRRERFIVFSYGESWLRPWLAGGWALRYHHFANEANFDGVMDNGLFEPFALFDISKLLPVESLLLKVAWLQSFQRDRKYGDGWLLPHGAMAELSASMHSFGMGNTFYVGTGLMPFCGQFDSGGHKYGTWQNGAGLYYADPFYKLYGDADADWKETGFYDRVELFWQPRIADYLSIRLSFVGHFVGGKGSFGYAGWQQKASLIFDLDRLLHPLRWPESIPSLRGHHRSAVKGQRQGKSVYRHGDKAI